MFKFKHTTAKIRNADGKFEGIPALRGESTYEMAVRNGFKGTEGEWLELIKYDQWIEAYNTLQSSVNTTVERANEVLTVAEEALDGVNTVKETANAAMPKAGGTFTGVVTAHNANDNALRLRNAVIQNGDGSGAVSTDHIIFRRK